MQKFHVIKKIWLQFLCYFGHLSLVLSSVLQFVGKKEGLYPAVRFVPSPDKVLPVTAGIERPMTTTPWMCDDWSFSAECVRTKTVTVGGTFGRIFTSLMPGSAALVFEWHVRLLIYAFQFRKLMGSVMWISLCQLDWWCTHHTDNEKKLASRLDLCQLIMQVFKGIYSMYHRVMCFQSTTLLWVHVTCLSTHVCLVFDCDWWTEKQWSVCLYWDLCAKWVAAWQ